MNNIRKYTAWLGAGAIMITLASGCANKDNDLVPDATENVVGAAANTTENVADAAVDTTTNMADAAVPDTTGNVIENSVEAGASNIEALGDAATMTPKIKTALVAEAALNGSDINVNTMGEKNSIELAGTVTSEAQKTMAEAVAKKNAPGYTIVNNLKMGGAM